MGWFIGLFRARTKSEISALPSEARCVRRRARSGLAAGLAIRERGRVVRFGLSVGAGSRTGREA